MSSRALRDIRDSRDPATTGCCSIHNARRDHTACDALCSIKTIQAEPPALSRGFHVSNLTSEESAALKSQDAVSSAKSTDAEALAANVMRKVVMSSRKHRGASLSRPERLHRARRAFRLPNSAEERARRRHERLRHPRFRPDARAAVQRRIEKQLAGDRKLLDTTKPSYHLAQFQATPHPPPGCQNPGSASQTLTPMPPRPPLHPHLPATHPLPRATNSTGPSRTTTSTTSPSTTSPPSSA